MTQHHEQPVPFCLVDANGQVRMRGKTLTLPTVAGLTTIAEEAPHGCYRGVDCWVEIPAAPGPHHTYDWASHAWVDRTVDQLRVAKLVEINAAFRAESAELVAGYPVEERQTWAAQESEALAWEADQATPTPYLDGIAAARGIDAALMRAKTLEAVLAFRSVSQWLVGTRQGLRDAIADPNATREQISAIAWPQHPQE